MDDLLCVVAFEDSPIPAGVLRDFNEVTVKRDGCLWRIHKNDADPFPSNPHAHNIESGLKMDLSTGALYHRSRPSGERIARKHLAFIRAQARAKGVVLPALAV